MPGTRLHSIVFYVVTSLPPLLYLTNFDPTRNLCIADLRFNEQTCQCEWFQSYAHNASLSMSIPHEG